MRKMLYKIVPVLLCAILMLSSVGVSSIWPGGTGSGVALAQVQPTPTPTNWPSDVRREQNAKDTSNKPAGIAKITLSCTKGTVERGDYVTYTLKISKKSDDLMQSVRIEMDFPDGLKPTRASITSGSASVRENAGDVYARVKRIDDQPVTLTVTALVTREASSGGIAIKANVRWLKGRVVANPCSIRVAR